MAQNAEKLEGRDFEKGCDLDKLAEGEMLLGHAFGEPVLVARRGGECLRSGRFAGTTGAHWLKV